MPQNHGCICDWGPNCHKWQKLFEKRKHPLGYMLHFEYSDSCNFQNSWNSIVTLLKPSDEKQKEIKDRYKEYSSMNQTRASGRQKATTFRVAAHHFPIEIVTMANRGNWTYPMTKDEVMQINCFPDRCLSTDGVIQYDQTLGKGKQTEWVQSHPNMYIKAPTVSALVVEQLYNDLISNNEAYVGVPRTSRVKTKDSSALAGFGEKESASNNFMIPRDCPPIKVATHEAGTDAKSASINFSPNAPSRNRAENAATAAAAAKTENSLANISPLNATTQTNDQQLKRNGITPDGDKITACGCRDKNRCRAIMWEWASLGPEFRPMVQYAFIPCISAKETALAEHVNTFHHKCLEHLLGNSDQADQIKANLSTKKHGQPVAIHHFKACLRESVRQSKATKKIIDKYRCFSEEGEEAGLTENDICAQPDSEGNLTYYALPTVTDYDEIEYELNQAKLKYSYQQKIPVNIVSTVKLKGSFETKETAYKELLERNQAEKARNQAEKQQYESKIRELQAQIEKSEKERQAEVEERVKRAREEEKEKCDAIIKEMQENEVRRQVRKSMKRKRT